MLPTEVMNELVDRLDHDIRFEDLTRETFDLPTWYVAEALIPAIASCLGVRIWITNRKETSLRGETETHRMLSMFGGVQDIDTAYWLFEHIEESIGADTTEFVNKYAFSINDRRLMQFEAARVSEIKQQLKEVIDYNHDEKEAIIRPAFARLNLKLTRKKITYVNHAQASLGGGISLT